MLNKATANETINPTAREIYWSAENELPLFARSRTAAASIVGTASKKENSTIVCLFKLSDNPPMIVAAERETPGNIASD